MAETRSEDRSTLPGAVPGEGTRISRKNNRGRKRTIRTGISVVVDPGVEEPPRKKGKGREKTKGLYERDSDPNAGRDRQNAAENLGLSPQRIASLPFESTLAYVFRNAGGKDTAINAARLLIGTDERFQRFCHAYDTATQRDKDNYVLEDLCATADIPPDEFLGCIIPALFRRNIDTGKLIAAVNHPKIVEATIRNAESPFGMPDRKMLLDHVGFLPQKAGMSINFDQRQVNMAKGNPTAMVEDTSPLKLPSFAEDVIAGEKALTSTILEQKRLPEPSPSQSVPVPEILEAEIVE